MDKVEVPISDENNGRQFTLHLTPQEIERAKSDSTYLEQLVEKFYREEAQNIAMDNAIIEQETVQNRDEDDDMEEKSLFIWNNDCIYLLLTLYEEHKEDFTRQRHKKVYENMAKKMRNINSNYKISGSQCQSKLSSLKKTYKKIKDHNNTSGNDRATWPYFERMQAIFGREVWIQPCAVASEAGPAPKEDAREKKKRKMENLLEELIDERKKSRQGKQNMLEKMLEMKERQHQEKMSVLKELCQNFKK